MTTNSQSSQNSMKTSLQTVFLNHPESIGESYFEHQRAAMGFAASLAITAAAAFLHALIPCLCENTARMRIESLNNKLQKRAQEPHCNEHTSRN